MVIGSAHKDLSIKGSKDWQATTWQPHVIDEIEQCDSLVGGHSHGQKVVTFWL